jgi:hypothetical protein
MNDSALSPRSGGQNHYELTVKARTKKLSAEIQCNPLISLDSEQEFIGNDRKL